MEAKLFKLFRFATAAAMEEEEPSAGLLNSDADGRQEPGNELGSEFAAALIMAALRM